MIPLRFSDLKEVTELTNKKVCQQWTKILFSNKTIEQRKKRMCKFVLLVNYYYNIKIRYLIFDEKGKLKVD